MAVGAPLFTNASTEGFDIGRVYVYYQTTAVSLAFSTCNYVNLIHSFMLDEYDETRGAF